MNPLFLSILVSESEPGVNHAAFLRRLPSVLRVRIVPEKNGGVIWPWLEHLEGRRISVDIGASAIHTLPEAFGADQRIRQVRITVEPHEVNRMPALIRHVRGQGTRPPTVFLLGAESLAGRPDDWAAVSEWQNVYVNPVACGDASHTPASFCAAEEVSPAARFAAWRARLGERMFVSLPAVAAHAKDEAAAPCPTKMGLHIVLDVERNCVRVCDCVNDPSIPLDDDGLWLEAWRNEIAALQSSAEEQCKGCSLWASCRGGCLAPRPDGVLRDRFCPWPHERFVTEGAS